MEMHPKDEVVAWNSTMKTNAILADLWDLVMATNTRKGHKPKEYPRPKRKQAIGKGAIPISDFWDWWNKKR